LGQLHLLIVLFTELDLWEFDSLVWALGLLVLKVVVGGDGLLFEVRLGVLPVVVDRLLVEEVILDLRIYHRLQIIILLTLVVHLMVFVVFELV